MTGLRAESRRATTATGVVLMMSDQIAFLASPNAKFLVRAIVLFALVFVFVGLGECALRRDPDAAAAAAKVVRANAGRLSKRANPVGIKVDTRERVDQANPTISLFGTFICLS